MTVTKQMSIGEVLSIDRSTAHIFMEFGMHCLGCPHATAESCLLYTSSLAPSIS